MIYLHLRNAHIKLYAMVEQGETLSVIAAAKPCTQHTH